MDEHEPQTVDSTVATIDRAVAEAKRGRLSKIDLVRRLVDAVMAFQSSLHASAADVELVTAYARDFLEADREVNFDPAPLDFFDDYLLARQQVPALEAHVASFLEQVESGLRAGGTDAGAELVDLCREGERTHHLAFRLGTSAEAVLRLAHTYGVVDALVAAVSPQYAERGQIANQRRSQANYRLAFDLLGHLAVDPTHGRAARGALLDLAGHFDTAGMAVIRLPVYLLDNDERQRLLDIHQARVDLLHRDPILMPVGPTVQRDNRAVQAALWQSFEAERMA